MKKPDQQYDLRVLSLGAGVQSTALYLMALDGELPEVPDLAVFADTRVEPWWVYENLHRLQLEGGHKIPIHICTTGSLGDSLICAATSTDKRYISVPFWLLSNGRAAPGRRQCTREYKIDPVRSYTRGLLGLRKGERAAGKFKVEEWIGISLDEVSRAKPSRYSWVTTRWPLLLDKPMRRWEIVSWLERRGWPTVQKSACLFCPWRGAVEYGLWRDHHPDVFEAACKWDDLLRVNGPLRGMRQKQFVLRELIPLRELPPTTDLLKQDNQLSLFDMECEGMCGF